MVDVKVTASRAFEFKEISASEVRGLLSDMLSAGFASIDAISASMLKFIPDELSLVLAKLFSMSVARRVLQTQWKAAVITPVNKKGNKADINNYRPILILPLMSKVFEKVVDRQFRGFLEGACLLSNSQHRFRKSRSCQTALLSLTSSLFTN